MSRTYDYDPTKISMRGKDRMRFELGDTMVEGGPDTSALCDEEYNAILSAIPAISWKRAKLRCLESICRRFAYEPDTKSGPLEFDFNERAKLWRQDYDKLKKEIGDEGTAVPAFGIGHDGRRKGPYFYGGMHQNQEAGTNETLHVPSSR